MQQHNSEVSPDLVADQLKMPLLQIRHLIELSKADRDEQIMTLASRALRTIDAYELAHGQSRLALEPVSVGSVMYDVAHQLFPYAQQYNCDIAIDSKGKHGSIMAERGGLQLLLELLGETLVAMPSKQKRSRIVLGAHTVKGEVIAGVFRTSKDIELSPRRVNGRSAAAWQPDASIGLAELLAVRLDTTLKPYHHNRFPGIGARFLQSSQLRLV